TLPSRTSRRSRSNAPAARRSSSRHRGRSALPVLWRRSERRWQQRSELPRPIRPARVPIAFHHSFMRTRRHSSKPWDRAPLGQVNCEKPPPARLRRKVDEPSEEPPMLLLLAVFLLGALLLPALVHWLGARA